MKATLKNNHITITSCTGYARRDDADYAGTERDAKRVRYAEKGKKMKSVEKEVIDKVEELTGSAARRGFRSFVLITPIDEDVKDRIEKEIDMF